MLLLLLVIIYLLVVMCMMKQRKILIAIMHDNYTFCLLFDLTDDIIFLFCSIITNLLSLAIPSPPVVLL